MKKILLQFIALQFIFIPPIYSQDPSFETLSLQNLSGFREQTGNWTIVGDVLIDPNVDIHHEAPQEVLQTKKRKKKKQKDAEVTAPKAVTFSDGSGILLNMNDDVKKDNLITVMEHGDIELSLEVMVPKGSNSGIYLQGRYEVQLLDSWGVKTPKYSDIGGIYRNWETEPGQIYMGKAPLKNAAKAPGLWQKLEIKFKAPRFDETGQKTENAKLIYVDLNGVRIHDHIEIPHATGGPVSKNEVVKGPIMIQGDHGPVAIRNIRYRLLEETKVSLEELDYQVFLGEFKSIKDFEDQPPTQTGTSNLSCSVAGVDNNFAIIFKGNLEVMQEGDYTFTLDSWGGTTFSIDGKAYFPSPQDGRSKNSTPKIHLAAGKHDFQLKYFNSISWIKPRLGLFVESPNSHPKALHTFDSYPPDGNNVSQIFVEAGNEPRMLRAFLDYEGDRSKRITHSIGVGDPSGLHYAYDLQNGNLACVWKGDFVNATPMWHDRGDGSFKPMGAVLYLTNNQQIAELEDSLAAFPEKSDKELFKAKGYEIEESSGRPVFLYSYKGVQISDKIYPNENGKIITRVIQTENNSLNNLHCKIAEGSEIIKMNDNTYVIDKNFYIKIHGNNLSAMRKVDDRQELIIPVGSKEIKYSIIW